jgi:hypothetical protein
MGFSQEIKSFQYFSYFQPSVFNFFNICVLVIFVTIKKKIKMSPILEIQGAISKLPFSLIFEIIHHYFLAFKDLKPKLVSKTT